MKKIIIPACIALILFTACGSARPTNRFADNSTQIIIECNNDRIIQHTIYQMLRSTNAKDIVVEKNGGFASIKAVFLNKNVSLYRIESIAQDIRNLPGVIESIVQENRNAVLQVAERAPVKLD